MVSDEQLIRRLKEFLRASDLTVTTTGTVRRQLESDFNVDLTDKKAFVREQVDMFLSELDDERNHGKEDEIEVEEEEEEDEESIAEEEEEEENEERSSRKRRLNKYNDVKKTSARGNAKLYTLSPQLQEFIGEAELTRSEIMKRLRAYIRVNNLQDPSNKKKILCDERLQNLFHVKNIDMFQMNKTLSRHIWPLDSEGVPVRSARRERKQRKDRNDTDESPPKRKRPKGGNYGFLAPRQLSEAMIKFIGTGENELPRSDVIKRIWDYIKENNLQDPDNKKNIICDEKLRELFNVDSFTGFTVSKLLGVHFVKTKQ